MPRAIFIVVGGLDDDVVTIMPSSLLLLRLRAVRSLSMFKSLAETKDASIVLDDDATKKLAVLLQLLRMHVPCSRTASSAFEA